MNTIFSPIGSVGRDNQQFSDGAVQGGLEYCYQVVAINGNGSSNPSNISCATPMDPEPPIASAPAAPEQLQALSLTRRRGAVELSWIDASNNETGFEVHRQEGKRKYRRIARLEANSSGFTDSRARTKRLRTCPIRTPLSFRKPETLSPDPFVRIRSLVRRLVPDRG